MNFVADLRQLTLNYEFETFLDQALSDRFVCGLKHESTQKRLLSEDKKLTFSRAVEIAQGLESAESKAKEFKGSQPAVFQVAPQHKGERKPCHRCGRSNHSEQMCRFQQATCHNCGKVGHIAPACRSCKTANSKRSNRRNSPENTKFVELETTDADSEGDLPLFTLGEKATNPIKVDISQQTQLEDHFGLGTPHVIWANS